MYNSKNKQTFFNGAAWLTISTVILKVIGLVYKIPLFYLLGEEGMGYFNSAYTVYTFFYIIGSSGIPKAISLLITKNEAEGNKETESVFYSTSCVLSVFGLLITAILVLLSVPISGLIGNINSVYSIVAISPSVFLVTISGGLRGYYSGKMNFLPIAVSELISGLLKLFLGLLFAYLAYENSCDLPIISAYAIFGITIGSFFSFVFLAVYKRKFKSKDSRHFNFYHVVPVLKLAAPITVATALGAVVNLIDLGMIINGLKRSGYSATLSTALYGNYTTLSIPMFSMVTMLLNPICTAAMPFFTERYSLRDIKGFRESITTSSKIIAFITFPCFFAFLAFPSEILTVIFDRESAVLGASYLAALSPAVICFGFLMLTNTVLESAEKVKAATLSLCVGTVLKALISITLISNESFGLLAAPIGTVLSYLVSFLISYPIMRISLNIKLEFKNTISYFLSSIFAVIPACIIRELNFVFDVRLKCILILTFFAFLYLAIVMFFSKEDIKKAILLVKMYKKKSR